MDDIVFYQPPSAIRSQSRLAETVTTSNLPLAPIISFSTRQTATLVSTLPQKTHTADWYCRNDKQEDFTASRNLPIRSDDDDDFSDMEELLSGTWQKSMPASADLNGDDPNGFIDIDELLSGVQQKGPTSVDLDYGGMADMVDNETRGSPTSSSRFTAGSSRDPIVLSNDESAETESRTDYSSFEVDLATKSEPSSPHITDDDMADSKGFVSRTTFISDLIVADHQDNDSGGVDSAMLQLPADLSISVSPSHGSFTHQASPMRINSEITQGSASYADLDVTKKAEEDNANTRSTLASQHGSAQFPRPGPAAASLRQSGLTNVSLQRPHRQRDDTKNVRHKRLRTPSPIGPASTASPISAALESDEFERAQSVTRLVAPAKEREIREIDHEMADDGDSDDSNDKDYGNISDTTTSEIQERPPSRKRVKRAKGAEHNDLETPSTHSFSVSSQATAVTSGSMQESEEIPIRGYLTLMTTGSKVTYCLTFSQELLPEPGGISRRQGIPKSVSSGSDGRDLEESHVQERAMNRPVRNSRFSSQDDELLLQLKGEGLSWDEISDRFPERSKGTLQVHYSTKLKSRFKNKDTKKRRRSKRVG